MAIKVPITTYRDNPAATFWSRLGNFLSYLTPLVFFCMLFVPLSFPNHGKMHAVLWVLWVLLSIAVAVVYFIAVFGLCAFMEQKALSKGHDQHSVRPQGRPPVQPGIHPEEAAGQSLHPSLQKMAGKKPPEGWDETTLR